MLRLPPIPSGRDLVGWPPVVIGLALLAALLTFSAGRIAVRAWAIARERTALDQRIRELQAEKARLEQEIAALSSPEAVERLAKAQLNLKNPGEEVVVVRAAEGTTTAEAPSPFSRLLPAWLRELVSFLAR